jgi:hypothetical protein
MEVLTVDACASWLLSRGGEVTSGGRPVLPANATKTVFTVPQESRAQVVLARQLAQWVDSRGGLLWLTDWPIFTPEEMDLFLEARRDRDGTRSLIDAPGHLLQGQQETSVKLAVLLFLLMAFNWEGYYFQDDGGAVIWMADEMIDVRTRHPDKTHLLRQVLDALHVTMVTRE